VKTALRGRIAAASMTALLAVGGGTAHAAAPPDGAQVLRFHYNSSAAPDEETVIATGPIHGIGDDVQTENGGTELATITFPTGTVQVTARTTGERVTADLTACRMTVAFSGIWSVVGGTDGYADASGGGPFTGLRIIHGERIDGVCQGPDSGLPPRLVTEDVRATGTVSLG
jgi:hypothetical protein